MENTFLFICVFAISFVLTFLVRKWAIRKSILDHPNERSSHSVPTPRGGGIAITVAWFAGLLYFRIKHQIDPNLFLALLSGILLSIIGFIDDIINLKPGIKFLSQFICAATGLFFLSGLKGIDVGSISFENKWIFTPLALVGIIWCINLFNFLDGIDGYISVEIIFIGLSVFLLFGDNIALLLTFAVVGFLFWNWQKAKIFMGDVCSTLLGYNVAIFAIYYQNTNKSSLIIWLILTSVFWLDATVTLFRRIKNKEKLSTAHRKHAFQRIVQAGFSHQKTVLWMLLLNLIGFGFVLLSLQSPKFEIFYLIVDVVFLLFILKYVDKKKPFEYSK
jgi:Fuc2NAc and GlcNAc transferase